MSGGENGPPIINGGANNFNRDLAFAAPVAFDTGLFTPPDLKTRAQLRNDLMIRLGFSAQIANPPDGMVALLNNFLDDAQQQLYVRYDALRTERWFGWQLTAGNRFYDVPISGVEYLNFRRITAAAITDNGGRALRRFPVNTALALHDFVMPTTTTGFEYEVTVAGTTAGVEPVWPTVAGGTVVSGTVTFTARTAARTTWQPIRRGIDAMDYNADQRSMPARYELDRYIEVWPAPDKPYVLWLKGQIGLMRFAEDTDLPTIDTPPLFLFALALAKDHYLKAGDKYAQMASRYIAAMVAQSHAGRRYIPSETDGGKKAEYRNEGVMSMPRATWRGE